MIWLLRFILLFLLFSIFYLGIKSLFNSSRKLDSARRHKRFLFLDDEDIRKNFFVTYKGVVFVGEKYMGVKDDSFDVISILIWPDHTAALKGLIKDDFVYLTEKILEKYPNAEIHWKSPVNEFLQTSRV
ncbi:sigma-w pathway protein ysdB [Bacillus sp. AFS076308]|uniref:sigma-w pathway protein ysdB n=1 Tax=unclassified Bacillus (in: firmicutes) TaxID=185979 RepID=UPI000BF9F66F|nr:MULTISPECIES: sigma-w pathway protein ysdB [unclassified Bacillus (in: firmicutes)]PFN79496.1 sigma-w pathway protein ysdB [Bacillus sp. AFS076308]PGV48910.1 sigma-w pathway protein ysdB [Bacillus sp. AFS037270]